MKEGKIYVELSNGGKENGLELSSLLVCTGRGKKTVWNEIKEKKRIELMKKQKKYTLSLMNIPKCSSLPFYTSNFQCKHTHKMVLNFHHVFPSPTHSNACSLHPECHLWGLHSGAVVTAGPRRLHPFLPNDGNVFPANGKI